MFTDWTMIDPHYFYYRGAIWGAVAATFFWYFVYKYFGRNK